MARISNLDLKKLSGKARKVAVKKGLDIIEAVYSSNRVAYYLDEPGSDNQPLSFDNLQALNGYLEGFVSSCTRLVFSEDGFVMLEFDKKYAIGSTDLLQMAACYNMQKFFGTDLSTSPFYNPLLLGFKAGPNDVMVRNIVELSESEMEYLIDMKSGKFTIGEIPERYNDHVIEFAGHLVRIRKLLHKGIDLASGEDKSVIY